tara:strand:- start:1767 stop:2027 length:261 start_codon:yes stop_codon:yes gene_type:complete
MIKQTITKYIQTVAFYFLEVVGAVLNLIGSFIGVYPSLDLGVAFLMKRQAARVIAEKSVLDNDKKSKIEVAQDMVAKAKGVNGKEL